MNYIVRHIDSAMHYNVIYIDVANIYIFAIPIHCIEVLKNILMVHWNIDWYQKNAYCN